MLRLFMISWLLTFAVAAEMKQRSVYLALEDCLKRALANDLDLRIESYNPEISKDEIIAQESAFDPFFGFNAGFSDFQKQKALKTTSGDGAQFYSTAEIYKKYALGTTIGVAQRITYDNYRDADDIVGIGDFDSFWSLETQVKISQPLLRNFGIDVNTAKINIAKNDYKFSRYEMKNKILQLVSDVRLLYLDLQNAYAALKFQEQSLGFAKTFYNITRQKILAGALPEMNIVEAERLVADRVDQLVQARQKRFLAENKLKKVIFPLDEDAYRNLRIIPESRATVEYFVDYRRSLEKAIENRPDLQLGNIELENTDIKLRYQENQLLPQLDLSSSVAVQALDGNLNNTYETFSDQDFVTWKLELSLDIPIGNRFATARYRQAQNKQKQAIEKLQKIKNQIMYDVNQAIVLVQTEKRRVETASKNRQLTEQQLINEKQRYENGIIALFQLQDIEQKLTKARINETKAIIDYQKAIVTLERSEGDLPSILKNHNLEILLQP